MTIGRSTILSKKATISCSATAAITAPIAAAWTNVGFVAKEDILGKMMWCFWDGTSEQIDASAIN
jgi:hypothetical protein